MLLLAVLAALAMLSGCGSIPGVGNSFISFGSWNARSLFVDDPTLQQRKISFLRRQVDRFTHFAVQEAKGSHAELAALKHAFKGSHHVFFSAGCGAAGGVILFHRVRDLPLGYQPLEPMVLVEGRCIISRFAFG